MECKTCSKCLDSGHEVRWDLWCSCKQVWDTKGNFCNMRKIFWPVVSWKQGCTVALLFTGKISVKDYPLKTWSLSREFILVTSHFVFLSANFPGSHDVLRPVWPWLSHLLPGSDRHSDRSLGVPHLFVVCGNCGQGRGRHGGGLHRQRLHGYKHGGQTTRPKVSAPGIEEKLNQQCDCLIGSKSFGIKALLLCESH